MNDRAKEARQGHLVTWLEGSTTLVLVASETYMVLMDSDGGEPYTHTREDWHEMIDGMIVTDVEFLTEPEASQWLDDVLDTGEYNR